MIENNSTWSGTGNFSGSTLLIADTSTGCSTDRLEGINKL